MIQSEERWKERCDIMHDDVELSMHPTGSLEQGCSRKEICLLEDSFGVFVAAAVTLYLVPRIVVVGLFSQCSVDGRESRLRVKPPNTLGLTGSGEDYLDV
ncbi:hypothetical protein F4776DRAFT_666008 [Hypoxylon sp. NC0597]|nr:hypothetical protein F4776DRAFT_666008 [Hypoxylon sp. NC0597]